jgi:hypothetical protein
LQIAGFFPSSLLLGFNINQVIEGETAMNKTQLPKIAELNERLRKED